MFEQRKQHLVRAFARYIGSHSTYIMELEGAAEKEPNFWHFWEAAHACLFPNRTTLFIRHDSVFLLEALYSQGTGRPMLWICFDYLQRWIWRRKLNTLSYWLPIGSAGCGCVFTVLDLHHIIKAAEWDVTTELRASDSDNDSKKNN